MPTTRGKKKTTYWAAYNCRGELCEASPYKVGAQAIVEELNSLWGCKGAFFRAVHITPIKKKR